MSGEEIKTVDDIEKAFIRHLMSDPIVRSIWQSGEHHQMTIEQRLKWMVSVFCEIRNDQMKKEYDKAMQQPFNPYFLREKLTAAHQRQEG